MTLKEKIKTYFIPKYWYLYWAVISSIFIPLSMVMIIINATTNSKVGFVFLLFQLISPMIFGIYLVDKQKFKINLYKFFFIFFILLSSVFFLGRLAMVVTPSLILLLMWVIKISKRESKWAFGSIMIYTFSALPGLLVMVYFHFGVYGLGLTYITQGAIYGKIMQLIYERKKYE